MLGQNEFPACAGMIRSISVGIVAVCRVPRMRGDDPQSYPNLRPSCPSSPHARG